MGLGGGQRSIALCRCHWYCDLHSNSQPGQLLPKKSEILKWICYVRKTQIRISAEIWKNNLKQEPNGKLNSSQTQLQIWTCVMAKYPGSFQIGHDVGNPWVTQPYLHPHPCEPVSVSMGMGLDGCGYGYHHITSHHHHPSCHQTTHRLTPSYSTTANDDRMATSQQRNMTQQRQGGNDVGRDGQGWALCPSLKVSVFYFTN